ncbi:MULTISPECIES: hypothetical protein [unclassified Saccharothrix]|uniref:hypothetical protein n=1 Tax=unclassified Saccharothrix TaxID=2593673 RepID=UPI00307CFDD0
MIGTIALTSTSLAVLTATPASADDYVPTTTVARAQWGYIDRAAPAHVRLNPAGDAPVGAGSGLHVTRSYFRFDLTAVDGASVLSAKLAGAETRAADCAVRAVQVWRTDELTSRSSWLRPPRERELLAAEGPVAGQCPAPIGTDVTAAITAAVQRGDDAITIGLRVPAEHEAAKPYGRAVANDLKLVVTHNRPPATPTGQQIYPDLGCATTAPGTYLNPARLNDAQRMLFSATVSDPDPGDVLSAEFAHWPVADPAAREVVQAPAGENGKVLTQANDWLFPVDGTHAWTVRALDGTAASAETAPCYFTIDRTSPEPPVVSSQVYPRGWKPGGGYGVPGDFTFDSPSEDVVAYEYRFQGSSDWTTVTPAAPGEPVTITYTPARTGYDYVSTRAVDRAGNRGVQYDTYSFEIFENRPFVWSDLYSDLYVNPNGGVGVPGRFDFSSNLTDVVSYTYRFDDGPETTVPADAARKASITHAPTHGGYNILKVRSTSSTGASSPEREHRFLVDTAPVITSEGRMVVGSTTRFLFTPRQANVASYTYWFSRYNGPDTEPVTVPAASDGTGGFTWAPLASDANSVNALRVRSTDTSGGVSETRYFSVYVDGAAPWIDISGNSPARPSTLTFTTSMASPVEYEYWFDHAPTVKYTVPAAPTGPTKVQHTIDRTGTLVLRARVRNAEGTWSAQGGANWWVHDSPDITSTDFPTWPDSPWREGAFTFRSNQPGATEFEYRIDDLVAVAPVGPDGTATVRWTPTHAGNQYLTVTSRTATGVVSSYSTYQFRVYDNPTITSTDFPAGAYSPWREGTFTFTSNHPGATEFLYTAADNTTTTVPVGPDGTATITWTPTRTGDQTLTVTTRTATGQVSATSTHWFTIFDVPSVTSEKYPEDYHTIPAGEPGDFTFATTRPGAISYTYRFDIDYQPGEEHTVTAGPDGRATITYAPPVYGDYVLHVTAHYADGTSSSTRQHNFVLWEPWV